MLGEIRTDFAWCCVHKFRKKNTTRFAQQNFTNNGQICGLAFSMLQTKAVMLKALVHRYLDML